VELLQAKALKHLKKYGTSSHDEVPLVTKNIL